MDKPSFEIKLKDDWTNAGFFDEFPEPPRRRQRPVQAIIDAPESEPQELETIDLATNTAVAENASRRREIRRSIQNSANAALLFGVLVLGTTTMVALTEADSHDSQANDSVKGKTEQPAPAPTTTTTIAPTLSSIGPDYGGPACSSKEVTIKPGDTVFGLTTKGLKDRYYGHYYVDQIFAWNLDYIKEQSKKDLVLADPGSIPIGHKLKIQTDCLFLDPVIPERDYANFDYDSSNPDAKPPIDGYRRIMKYQFYEGTDGKTHNLVEVDYSSNSKGEFLAVEDCYPDPECYDYVAGMPKPGLSD